MNVISWFILSLLRIEYTEELRSSVIWKIQKLENSYFVSWYNDDVLYTVPKPSLKNGSRNDWKIDTT